MSRRYSIALDPDGMLARLARQVDEEQAWQPSPGESVYDVAPYTERVSPQALQYAEELQHAVRNKGHGFGSSQFLGKSSGVLESPRPVALSTRERDRLAMPPPIGLPRNMIGRNLAKRKQYSSPSDSYVFSEKKVRMSGPTIDLAVSEPNEWDQFKLMRDAMSIPSVDDVDEADLFNSGEFD